MCACTCHQEAALGSRPPRNRGKLVARPVPCDKSPLVRKPVNDQSPKSKGNAASPWHDVLTSRHSHRSSTRTPRGAGSLPQLRFLSAIPALSPPGGNTRQCWKNALAEPELTLRQPAARILRLFRLPAVLRALPCV